MIVSLICTVSIGVNFKFEPLNNDIPNPERGFYDWWITPNHSPRPRIRIKSFSLSLVGVFWQVTILFYQHRTPTTIPYAMAGCICMIQWHSMFREVATIARISAKFVHCIDWRLKMIDCLSYIFLVGYTWPHCI